MKIDGSGQRKTQRGLCSRAHGKRDPFDTSYRVPKRSSDRFLARRPCPQVPQCHPRVARLSGTGVKPVFGRCPGRSSARHPSPQVPLWHPGVAKRSSIDASAQRPYPQVLQCHLCVARPLSMKWALFVDIEVWIGCSSMKWVLFVDVEVRSRCSAGPSPRPPYPQVLQWHPCKPRRLESQDNARDKGGGNDCVRCVGSGFDLALRDGVRIFE